jgi:predicted transcriptional regulator YdeE/heme-degrading monooxygenase HmoA
MWHGRTKRETADVYAGFLAERAVPDYQSVPGNVSVTVLRRDEGSITHFITLTLWRSEDAIRGFAGNDLLKAKYYPEDKDFLLEFETFVQHFSVVSSAAASSLQPVRYERGRPMLLAGLRRHHSFAESGSGITEQWQQFRSIGHVNGQVGMTAYGVMCAATPDGLEYMCAVEVDSFAELPEHLGRMRIQAQDYAVFIHQGQVSSIRTTWEEIFKWLAEARGYESAHRPDFEVYDKSFDPLTGLGGVEIWISVSERKLNPVAS